MHRIGVCGTDLHASAGKQPFFSYPRILGHELELGVEVIDPGTEPHDLTAGGRCLRRAPGGLADRGASIASTFRPWNTGGAPDPD